MNKKNNIIYRKSPIKLPGGAYLSQAHLKGGGGGA